VVSGCRINWHGYDRLRGHLVLLRDRNEAQAVVPLPEKEPDQLLGTKSLHYKVTSPYQQVRAVHTVEREELR
jgi:hypothetical protein